MEDNERLRILRMIAEGKVSPEEGETLLRALQTPSATSSPDKAQDTTEGNGRWLRIRIQEDGRQRVNVRLPLRLVEFGLKIARRFSSEEDLDQIAAAINEAVQAGIADGKIIDIEDDHDKQHVEIWFE